MFPFIEIFGLRGKKGIFLGVDCQNLFGSATKADPLDKRRLSQPSPHRQPSGQKDKSSKGGPYKGKDKLTIPIIEKPREKETEKDYNMAMDEVGGVMVGESPSVWSPSLPP